jgi:hypothetical protein
MNELVVVLQVLQKHLKMLSEYQLLLVVENQKHSLTQMSWAS